MKVKCERRVRGWIGERGKKEEGRDGEKEEGWERRREGREKKERMEEREREFCNLLTSVREIKKNKN